MRHINIGWSIKTANLKLVIFTFIIAPLILTGCNLGGPPKFTVEHIQVAPNTAAKCNSAHTSNCLIIRFLDGVVSDWGIISSQLPDFHYGPGYLYDIEVQKICTKSRDNVSGGNWRLDLKVKVTNKILSSENAVSTAELKESAWPGNCLYYY
jgi:hypothetical protein